MLNKHKIRLTKTLTHCFLLGALVITYYQALIGYDLNGEYINDPVKYIIHFTGMTALQVLLLTLCISPLAKQFKQAWLMHVRRMLGLYVFFCALLHVLSFWFFELNFQFSLFIEELSKRPYIWLGMTAFLLLLALAITSINSIRSKMGRHWQKLHNWVYLAAALIWLHFYWSVKATPLEPMVYLAVVIALLALRKNKFTTHLNT